MATSVFACWSWLLLLAHNMVGHLENWNALALGLY